MIQSVHTKAKNLKAKKGGVSFSCEILRVLHSPEYVDKQDDSLC